MKTKRISKLADVKPAQTFANVRDGKLDQWSTVGKTFTNSVECILLTAELFRAASELRPPKKVKYES